MKNAIVAGMLILGLCAHGAEKMNVLMLTVDDMNCDSVGAFGCPVRGTTPNIDTLAADGIQFNHAHVHASSCVPSRNIVMTGRFLYNSKIEGFYAVPTSLHANPTMPGWLRANGYFTMIINKESHSTPYYPFDAWDIDFKQKGIEGNSRHPDNFYRYTKEGIEAAQAAGKPFFYNVNINDPHLALYNWSPKKGPGLNRQDIDNRPSRIYGPDEIVVPGFLPDTPLVRQELAAYYSTVRRADDSVAKVIQALRDTGTYDSTIIVFFSDHGMPFPFAKTAIWYHSTHTPLIVRWPGMTKGGVVDDEHVLGTVDIFPTLVEGVGGKSPEGLDGRSFLDLLKGKKQKGREYVYTMYEENVGGNRQPMRSVISKTHGYIFSPWSDGERTFATATRGMASTKEIARLAEAGDKAMQKRYDLFMHSIPEQFFDYANDPDALNDLFANPEYSKVIEQYRRQMVTFMKRSSDPLLDILENRHNAEIVQGYLVKLDAESKARKQKPEIYKRNYGGKANKAPEQAQKKQPPKTGAQLPLKEYLRRAKQRAEKQGKTYDEKKSTERYEQLRAK